MSNKKQLGQFYSTNADILLRDFVIGESVIEPFAGNGDLINWAKRNGLKRYLAYDLDPPNTIKYKCLIRDTLADPPKYDGKFVLTNPPYLAKNKNADKSIYDEYGYDDLYKIFISQILNKVIGGIIIIPLNFLSTRLCPLRNTLFSEYKINQINLFLNPIFVDTTYTVCSIWFEKSDYIEDQDVKIYIHDIDTYTTMNFQKDSDWLLGGDIYNLTGSTKVSRLTSSNNLPFTSNIKLIGLDTRDVPLHLEYNTTPYIGKNSDRMFATLTFDRAITVKQQKSIIRKFNKLINEYRDKYLSLFLSNYRDFGRKRISFDLVYNIVSHIYAQL